MTIATMKKAFRELDVTEQANVLRELAASHANSLADMDAQDEAVFDERRRDEAKGRPLDQVVARLKRQRKGRRNGL